MTRPVPAGTPDRPKHYPPPRRRGRLALLSLAAPLLTLLVAFGMYSLGRRTVASPAPVILGHAPVEGTCVECHRSSFPHTVSDLRCERCHDPRVTGRLELAAHMAWIPPSHQTAATSPAGTCVSCHVDHRGRRASLTGVGVGDCTRCHRFTGLATHPQFAMVDAAKGADRGLHFSHARHVDEVRRTLGGNCETCHQPRADLSSFEPTSFDGQCATCHLTDGMLPVITDPIPASMVTSAAAYTVRRPGRGTIVVSGLSHKDPWLLQNLRTLARGVYTEAEVRENAALEARIAALDRTRSGELADEATPDLEQRLTTARTHGDPLSPSLAERIGLELERRAAGKPGAPSLATTLSEERALETSLTPARKRLATLIDRMSVPALPPGERARRLDAIASLVAPCLTCHVLQNGVEFAPIAVDARRMERASFTHAPHVIQVPCEKCHDTVRASALATDLNIPGVQTCRTCHATGQAPDTCSTCHHFHPSPEAGFGRAAFTRR